MYGRTVGAGGARSRYTAVAGAVVVDLFGRTGNSVALPQRGARISWITLAATGPEKRRVPGEWEGGGGTNRTRTEDEREDATTKGRGHAY